jgi:predicted Zn-dependent protease
LGEAAAALSVCGDRPELKQHVLEALVLLKRYPDAEKLAFDLSAKPPRDRRALGRLAHNLGRVFQHTRHPKEAEVWLRRELALGQADCETLLLLAEAARAQGNIEHTADALDAAFKCGKEQDPSLLIAAATFLAEAGYATRARSFLDQCAGRPLSADQAEQLERVRQGLAAAAGPRP